MVYIRHYVQAGNAIIALRFVESMEYPTDKPEIIIDRLKDDLKLILHMTSGDKHVVSMAELQGLISDYQAVDKAELRTAIVEKWIHLLGK